jgi:O-antigen/teichoic acid export membrane protein
MSERKLEAQSFFSYLSSCLWIIFLILFFLIFRRLNLTTVFSLWLAGVVISLILSFIYIKNDVIFFFTKVKKLSRGVIKTALIFSLPLIPVMASRWIITAADRYMINYFKGPELVGIYSLSYSLVWIIPGFSLVISRVLYPYIAKAWGEKENYQILFNALLKYILIITLPAMIGLLVLRKQIITLISGPAYLPGSSVIAILILSLLFAVLINVYYSSLLLRGKTKLIAYIYLGGAVLNILLNLFLIPLYEINGAAISTVATYIFIFLLFHFISRKQLIWNFKFLRINRIVLSSLLMGSILMLINPQTYITKILTIILGIIIYFSLLFLLHVFIKEEQVIIKSFLSKQIKNP